jgi:2,4-dienoyl-CoA reductase (NADPH2)
MSGATERIGADTVIVVGERRARDWSSMAPDAAAVQVIGDALVPRKTAHAISEGRGAAERVAAARPRATAHRG